MAGRASSLSYIASLLIPLAILGGSGWALFHRDMFRNVPVIAPEPEEKPTPEATTPDDETSSDTAMGGVHQADRPATTATTHTTPVVTRTTPITTRTTPVVTRTTPITTTTTTTTGTTTTTSSSSTGSTTPTNTTEKKPQPIDWKNREITGALPNPNVVIYGKSGYVLLRNNTDNVRLYRHVTVSPTLLPTNASAAYKSEAPDDGSIALTPYRDGDAIPLGYITATGTDATTPNLIDMDSADFSEFSLALKPGTIVQIVNK